MIYSLRGKLIEVGESAAVVECAGVGYLCSTTRTTLNSLPPKGSEVMLYTYLNIREGAVDLFGFSTLAEQRCFRQLTSVSGVGPKVALGILSELKPDQLMLSLVSQDVKSLTRAPGVGKKLAERILVVLCYRQSEAARAVAGQPPEASVQELIKVGLKKLSGAR